MVWAEEDSGIKTEMKLYFSRQLEIQISCLINYTCIRILPHMSKQKLTLTVDDALIERMKIIAVRLKRSLSDITEQLYQEYLKQQGKAKK